MSLLDPECVAIQLGPTNENQTKIPQSQGSEPNPPSLHKVHPPQAWHSKLPRRGAAFVCIALAIYTLFMYLPTISIVVSPCWAITSCLTTTKSSSVLESNIKSMLLATNAKLNRLETYQQTDLRHIVFGIASTVSNWENRQEYVKLWWQPPAGGTPRRGFVWLEEPLLQATNVSADNLVLPDVRISGNTDRFLYTWKGGSPSAIRVSRIVSETFRLSLPDVRWFVLGDDDTIFFPENLAMVLQKYDHTKLYYLGQSSESHKQSARHSFGMAYGGGGIAISYALAESLEKMQDGCLTRYPHVYGSDSRIEACAAELGIPLTREPGFHQIDMHGDIFGLLAAHPVKPVVSLHHVDSIEPIFPNMTRLQALQHLVIDGAVSDPVGTLQQSICYDTHQNVTLSVSWGYAVQIFEGTWTPLEVQKPSMTFLDWRTGQADEELFTFDVRRLPEDECTRPVVFFMESVRDVGDGTTSIGVYKRWAPSENCRSFIGHNTVEVHKQRQGQSWLTAPRRQGCEVVPQKLPSVSGLRPLIIHVRDFKDNEIIAPYE
ncbi:hypothetical protein GOP47_0026705 [Adiantum capillus-veneris]|nr:hypothetical protein GOP47_0026705 [Adiantum capillus-veneris]